MATTSPDNIRTPDPGDPYNLVPDLQTLAQDVQDALIARGNVFRGTAAQREAFLSTASPGMLWQDTDGIGMLWKRGASQWVPAVWRWSGTTAQMNGFTQAPNGFEWFNTTNNREYIRLGGAWKSTIQTGTVTFGAIAGNGAQTRTVTFPAPFSEIPVVSISLVASTGPSYAIYPISVTTTGMIINIRNIASASQTPGDVRWSAIGAPS